MAGGSDAAANPARAWDCLESTASGSGREGVERDRERGEERDGGCGSERGVEVI